MTQTILRFGTLGAAKITPGALIKPCADEPQAQIAVVAARDRNRAEQFAVKHGIPIVVDSYDEVVNHPDINAVYNPLPITAHHEWTLKALAAGKHVLCEKSFAANAKEAEEMAAATQASGLVVMDAFHYRYHPMFVRAREIYSSGVLGEIRSLDAAFHIPVKDPGDIRMNYETGGGVTMDIGCYPISWVRHITGDEPDAVSAIAEVGPANVDLFLTTEMEFPGGIKATTSGDMRESSKFVAYLKVEGSKGSMFLQNPIAPQAGNRMELTIAGETTEETFTKRPTYSFQLDAFIDAVANGASMYTDAADGAAQMRLIDRCYEAAGLPLRGLTL